VNAGAEAATHERAAASVVVHEIYASVQGESSRAGRPCTLVRLSGCNLRCSYCDTPQAFHGGSRMAVGAAVEKALSFGTELVLVTGGEPLLQPGVHALMGALCDAGKEVMLETSGERDVGEVDARVVRVIDLKAPSSGECQRNRMENLEILRGSDELKFVLGDREDYLWARALIGQEQLHTRVAEVLLGCVHGALEPRELVAWVLEDRLPVRVQLQLHKYIWSPDTQGV